MRMIDFAATGCRTSWTPVTSPPAGSTIAPLSISPPAISWGMTASTCSPASAAGITLLLSLDGPAIGPSGPAPALASLSAAQARAEVSRTIGISGPRWPVSSASARLQSSLASRLKARLDGRGSTLFLLTWKEQATPAGRPFSLVFPAAGVGAPHLRHRTYWVAAKGWPTPTTRDWEAPTATGRERAARRAAGEGGVPGGLADAGRERRQHFGHDLGSEARLPGVKAAHRTATDLAGRSVAAMLAGWPTPTSKEEGERFEHKDPEPRRSRGTGWGHSRQRSAGGCSGFDGLWADVEWLPCRDGKWRPTQPGPFPLAHGAAARVGTTAPPTATRSSPSKPRSFIQAALDSIGISSR